MKNLIIIGVLLFAFNLSAQGNKSRSKVDQFTPEEMATLQSKRMTLNLDLSETQQKEVHKLLLTKLKVRKAKMDARSSTTAKPNKDDKYKKMNASLDQKTETKAQLKSILTEAQYKKWEKSLKQKKKKSERKPNN